MSFNSLGLSDALLRAIDKKGYTAPSLIQEKAIPLILERKDVLASAQTGTGKTAGFTLPILQILSEGQQFRKRPIRALILTPTRELAAQILDNVRAYSEFVDIRSMVVFGGVKANPQIRTLRNGVDQSIALSSNMFSFFSFIFLLGIVSLSTPLYENNIDSSLALIPKGPGEVAFKLTCPFKSESPNTTSSNFNSVVCAVC